MNSNCLSPAVSAAAPSDEPQPSSNTGRLPTEAHATEKLVDR